MPSSTSSSESEPVILRPVPELRWPRVAVVALLLAAVGLGGWEAYWRVAQQYEASYRNSDGQWASRGTRIEGSYMARLSISPCSPHMYPLSPM